MPIEYDADGIGDLDRRLARFVAQMLDLRPFWPRVSTAFIELMALQFATEGRAGGEPWAPLSPAYAARKARLRPGKGILVYDGGLRRSVSTPRRIATPTELNLVIEDPKVGWHQGRERAKGVPRRVIVPEGRLPETWRLEIERLASEYVAEVKRREGL